MERVHLLPMSDDEIVRWFRGAKNRMEQIQILADLNDCKKAVIVDILRKGGVAHLLPSCYKPKAKPMQWVDVSSGRRKQFLCAFCGEVCEQTVMGVPRWLYCPMCGTRLEGVRRETI